MNIFDKLQDSYDQLWKYIIRPTRTPYPDSALGPETFCLEGIKIKRNSFQLINDRAQVFYGSHFVPLQASSYPCVIYLHGNSSNQTEGMQYLGSLIKNGISLCTFDFAACGNSQGQYVTLGYNEWRDVEEVMTLLKSKQKVTKIAIWGRSMGAVTAMRYIAKHPEILAAVYDSPFRSLKSLVNDLCKKNSKIPTFILSGALKIIASTIKEKANFDIYDLDPLKNQAPFIKVPGYFIVAKNDQLIPNDHSERLFEAYGTSKKKIQTVQGTHNSTRSDECINKVIDFLKKQLFKSKSKQNKTPTSSKNQNVDFFNDDLIQEINKNNLQKVESFASSETSQKQVDFFAEQTKRQDFHFDSASKHQKSEDNSSASGVFEMLSGIFKGKPTKSKSVEDGYEQLRNKIATLAFVNTLNKQIEQKIQKQLKVKDNSFQKLFSSEPEQYIW